MEQTIPLEVAAQHYSDAMRRGLEEGRRAELARILKLLKEKGEYRSIALLKSK